MPDKPTILIVDDEERNIRLLKAFLAPEEYRLLSAENGEDALQKVCSLAPDLVLLDVMMPDMDGFEACRKIKADPAHRAIPVIMVTSLTAREDRLKAMEAGADDFLSKPIEKTELLIRIRSLLRIKSYHDQVVNHLREIEGKNEKLSQLERVKEELTHMIVHDLNNPLTGISGCLELVLMDREDLSEQHRDLLSDSLEQCRNLDRLIGNILDISRLEEGKLKLDRRETDPVRLIHGVASLFKRHLSGKGISLSIEKQGALPLFRADPDLVQRVLANLFDNAVRHAPQGGRIEVRLQCSSPDGEFLFSIQDNGRGLDPVHHEKVFDKYEQVASKREGGGMGRSGLGLVFCKMAVEAHGGRIWVVSDGKNHGATFLFTIPGGSSAHERQNGHEEEKCSGHRRQ